MFVTMKSSNFLIFLGFLTLSTCYPDEVTLPQGVVKGHLGSSENGRDFLAFEGIPYAKPPVGDLRFAPPIPADQWEGVLQGDQLYSCAQLIPIPFIWGPSGTEDCLYLYVYVPGSAIKKTANLPVIVHIHGGAFLMGSPKLMALPDYLMDHDVIFVTMNYRLGVLGFLSTEDDVVPGNMGLKDQSLALKWIKENIGEFGGNPDSITITGLSAGAASVHYHYLSPLSKGLFSRGISHSGTAIQSWALLENPLEKAKFVAKNVSCTTENTQEMVTCLRTKKHEELIIAIDGLFVLLSSVPVPFGPVVEKSGSNNAFIEENPYKLLKEGRVYDVPWINSNVKDEGIFPVGFYSHMNKMNYISENWDVVMPPAFDMNDTVENSEKIDVVKKIKKYYFDENPVEENAETLIKVYNDRFFLIDSELATRTHAKVVKSPVYYYFYNFLPETNFKFKNIKQGVSHGLDARLVYKWLFFSNLKENETKMMHVMTNFVTNYAIKGIPEVGGVEWNPILPDEEEMNYLEINAPDDVEMKSLKELGPKEFWDSLPIQENNHIY